MNKYTPAMNQAVLSGPYLPITDTLIGQVRFIQGQLQVYTGQTWQSITIAAPPTLVYSDELDKIFQWAYNKMEQEKALDELCKEYPALQNARDSYEVVKQLVIAEEKLNAV